MNFVYFFFGVCVSIPVWKAVDQLRLQTNAKAGRMSKQGKIVDKDKNCNVIQLAKWHNQTSYNEPIFHSVESSASGWMTFVHLVLMFAISSLGRLYLCTLFILLMHIRMLAEERLYITYQNRNGLKGFHHKSVRANHWTPANLGVFRCVFYRKTVSDRSNLPVFLFRIFSAALLLHLNEFFLLVVAVGTKVQMSTSLAFRSFNG